jgi:hypothetical protein
MATVRDDFNLDVRDESLCTMGSGPWIIDYFLGPQQQ